MKFDAHEWTGEFCRVAREKGHHLDKDWVFGWFSNALQCGFDEGKAQTIPSPPPPITEKPKSGKK